MNTCLTDCQTDPIMDNHESRVQRFRPLKIVYRYSPAITGYIFSSFSIIKKSIKNSYNRIRNYGIMYRIIMFKKKFLDKRFHRNNVLYAFYDRDVMASSFDIIPFLVLAEKTRIQKDLDSLHVVMVPGLVQGFSDGYFKYYQTQTPDKTKVKFSYLEWRVRNILVPCCWLIPSCKQLTVCESRKEAQEIENLLAEHIFPDHYLVSLPRSPNKNIYQMDVTSDNSFVPSIVATQTACDFVSEWIEKNCEGKKVVVITLREAWNSLDRNSNIKSWTKFARSLDQNTFIPVFVRDTETAFQHLPEELNGLKVFCEACWNLEIRAALYQMVYLNLFVSSGPVALSWFNNISRFLVFKLVTKSVSVTTENNLNFVGLYIGVQPPYLSKFQKLVWDDDNYEVIKREFEEMCKKIDDCESLPP